jgi:hypothetical protein
MIVRGIKMCPKNKVFQIDRISDHWRLSQKLDMATYAWMAFHI